ncbi:MAG: hypothetical protein CM1200mP29_03700 [Verrucomicrobiota bacterium]|nr:MAG: hypothetical protein CM1200mP29_03700 [Verrucomicrobiota bacterium]
MEKLLGLSQERGSSVFAVMRDESALGQFQRRTVDSILDFVELVESTNERLNRPIAVHPQIRSRLVTAWWMRWACSAKSGAWRRTRRGREPCASIVDLLDSMDPDFVPGIVRRRIGSRFLSNFPDPERDEEDEAGDAVTLIPCKLQGTGVPARVHPRLEDGLSRTPLEG